MMYYNTRPEYERYYRPKTLERALSLRKQHGEQARLLAGGTDLLNLMRNRAVIPKFIIDISEIRKLDYVRTDANGDLKIGACTRLGEVENSPIVRKGWPVLAEAMSRMGMLQLRNMGTVVGNLCRASPSADSAPPLLVMDASLELTGSDGTRLIPLADFFTGPGQTKLRGDEIVTAVQVSKLPAGAGTAFLKQTRTAEDLAKVNVAALVIRLNNTCKEARIALGGVAATPIRARKAEAMLKDKPFTAELVQFAATAAAEETKPITDVRSTAEYRRELSKVLVSRALNQSWEKAQAEKGA